MSKKYIFRKDNSESAGVRILVLLVLLTSSLFALRSVASGEVKSPFLPTPTPTRTANSYAMEGDTQFQAGNLDAAIQAYQKALETNPSNAEIYYELARIQAYSSNLLTTDQERATRLGEAKASADKAVELAPEDSTAHAIRAFVLNWNANSAISGDDAPKLLAEAEQEATKALSYDQQNTLALAYYAEILTDELQWVQAEAVIGQALERDNTLMDVHRVHAYVLETLGDYNGAINAYEQAIKITPNLTFLYLRVGVIYRHLKQYDRSLEYFVTAVDKNEQLGLEDPLPYLAIGKVYTQTGDFYSAGLNVRKALQINPYSPDVYGQLGMVYHKARNYESAIEALKCAVRGCDAEETCAVRQCDDASKPSIVIEGMPLTSTTVVYYYIYGSVLAGMHRPSNHYCTEALQVLDEVRAKFSGDTTIMSIVESSEAVCAAANVTR